MAELVDALDLGSSLKGKSSSLLGGTIFPLKNIIYEKFKGF